VGALQKTPYCNRIIGGAYTHFKRRIRPGYACRTSQRRSWKGVGAWTGSGGSWSSC